MSDVLSEHLGLQTGWFSGYPTGKVQLEEEPAKKPFLMYINFDNVQVISAEERSQV